MCAFYFLFSPSFSLFLVPLSLPPPSLYPPPAPSFSLSLPSPLPLSLPSLLPSSLLLCYIGEDLQSEVNGSAKAENLASFELKGEAFSLSLLSLC